MNATQDAANSDRSQPRRLLAVFEVALIFLLLFSFAGTPPPGDDEPHYLGKAKQYWNPDWLAGDFFLETPDAHVVFNWTLGPLTLFFSLTAVSWIGRCAAWLLLAIAWRRLSWALVPKAFVAVWTMGLFLMFQELGTAALEWIVRGVEAKCFAYVFVIFGLERLVRGRWHWVWPLFGVAAAFHVLVGGWAVVAGLLAWVATKERPSLISMLPSLIAGGLLSLPGLIPGLLLSANSDPRVVAEANYIYVFERLKHHLVVYEFAWRNKVQFLCVLAAWLLVCFFTRGQEARLPLRRFVLATLVIGIAGLLIDQTLAILDRPDLSAALLRFYWYRLADVMVPVGLALALAEWTFGERRWPPARYTQIMLGLLVLAPTIYVAWDIGQQRGDGRPTADIQGRVGDGDADVYSDWRKTCAWAEANTRPSARFMIPPNISSFRWYAQRSEVVSRKDIPQNPAGIVEWKRRLVRVSDWYHDVSQYGLTDELRERLLQMASPEEYDFQYVIISRRYGRRRLPLPEAYAPSRDPLASYIVYRIPPETEDDAHETADRGGD